MDRMGVTTNDLDQLTTICVFFVSEHAAGLSPYNKRFIWLTQLTGQEDYIADTVGDIRDFAG